MNTNTYLNAEKHQVTCLGENRYRVQSHNSKRAYLVDLSAESPVCNCRFMHYKPDGVCSHIKAAYLVVADIIDCSPAPEVNIDDANDLLFGFS